MYVYRMVVVALAVVGGQQRRTSVELFNSSSTTPSSWVSTVVSTSVSMVSWVSTPSARTAARQQHTCQSMLTAGRCIRTLSVRVVVGWLRVVASTMVQVQVPVVMTRAAGAATSTTITRTSTICYRHHHHLYHLHTTSHRRRHRRHVTTGLPTTTTRTRLDSRCPTTWPAPDVYWRADSTTWRLKTDCASTSDKRLALSLLRLGFRCYSDNEINYI